MRLKNPYRLGIVVAVLALELVLVLVYDSLDTRLHILLGNKVQVLVEQLVAGNVGIVPNILIN